MSITKNMGLVREVEKHLRGGIEKKVSLPPPGTRFEKLGTIFSRVTGLIKSGVVPPEDIPIWYHVYKTYPPKYEPTYERPPMDIKPKNIYYPEDKLRVAVKRWEVLDLNSSLPVKTQKLVSEFRERRSKVLSDEALIEDILKKEGGEDEIAALENSR